MSPSAHENKEANDDRRVLVLGTRTEQRGWSSRCENGRNSPWSNLCAVMGIAEWFMPVAYSECRPACMAWQLLTCRDRSPDGHVLRCAGGNCLPPPFPRAFQCKARGASEGRFSRACRCHGSGVLPRRRESMRQHRWPVLAFLHVRGIRLSTVRDMRAATEVR